MFWCILHGGTDRGRLYWSGFNRDTREHTFSRSLEKAIKFYSEDDALRAGLNLPQGIRVERFVDEGR